MIFAGVTQRGRSIRGWKRVTMNPSSNETPSPASPHAPAAFSSSTASASLGAVFAASKRSLPRRKQGIAGRTATKRVRSVSRAGEVATRTIRPTANPKIAPRLWHRIAISKQAVAATNPRTRYRAMSRAGGGEGQRGPEPDQEEGGGGVAVAEGELERAVLVKERGRIVGDQTSRPGSRRPRARGADHGEDSKLHALPEQRTTPDAQPEAQDVADHPLRVLDCDVRRRRPQG